VNRKGFRILANSVLSPNRIVFIVQCFVLTTVGL